MGHQVLMARLEGKIDALEARLETKIDGLEVRLETKIDGFAKSDTASIHGVCHCNCGSYGRSAKLLAVEG